MHPNELLTQAAQEGDVQKTESALRQGADPNEAQQGWTPLMWAAQEGHAEIVALLLAAGAKVDFTDAEGNTPLQQAICDSHLLIAERLILAGADLHRRNEWDENATILHIAAAYGLLDSIRLLLQYGADRTAENDAGLTPRDLALQCGEEEAAALL